MTRSRPLPWLWIGLTLLVLFIVGGIGLLFIGVALAGGGGLGRGVGLIELSGVISDEGARTVLGGSAGGAREFIESVEAARRDAAIKTVVIRINSPGGSAAASQEMYQAVRRLHEKKKVVCSMGDVAASGGYYVASACDKIYANGSTLTGSIGVISEYMNFAGLFQKLGVGQDTIKSGQFKDTGNMARPLTAAERQLSHEMIMSVYGQFVDDVVAGRNGPTGGKLTKAALLKLADGRVYTGKQAKANLLIDEIGGLRDATLEAGRLGGLKGETRARHIGGGGILDALGAGTESSMQRGLAGAAATAGAAFAAGFVQRLNAEANPPARLQAR